ncbi:MAG: S1C family serine protease, partial [Acidimicrobiales bacterium]
PPPVTPPTAGWARPPVSDDPPRPMALARSMGPEHSPLPPSALPVAPPRARRRLLLAAGGTIVALSLVSGGFALGTVLSDDDPAVARSPGSIRPALDTNEPDPVPVPLDPGPLADDQADEPVAAVAAAVSPSVVLISTARGQGSGIVWQSDDGYIVTNQHVVDGLSAVQVQFADGTVVDGDVVGGSTAQDVAVVLVDPDEAGDELVPAVFAPSATIEVGQLAVAIGSPFGLDQSVTAGVVSAIRINGFGGSDPSNPVPVEMIQTDAPINPGNSGGALADRQGRVVGMNTSIRTDSSGGDGNVGVGFALPSDTVLLIADRIVNNESLEFGFLGISSDPAADNEPGVLVTQVEPGTPAEEVGLQVGDRIVAINGEQVTDISQLSAMIKLYRPGDEVELELVRDGSTLLADVVLGSLEG